MLQGNVPKVAAAKAVRLQHTSGTHRRKPHREHLVDLRKSEAVAEHALDMDIWPSGMWLSLGYIFFGKEMTGKSILKAFR